MCVIQYADSRVKIVIVMKLIIIGVKKNDSYDDNDDDDIYDIYTLDPLRKKFR
jgi:uncharacterized protein YfkK (UPF0435 family)